MEERISDNIVIYRPDTFQHMTLKHKRGELPEKRHSSGDKVATEFLVYFKAHWHRVYYSSYANLHYFLDKGLKRQVIIKEQS